MATDGELYEICLVEWHVTPEYINQNWTEEEFYCLLQGRNRRLLRSINKDVREKEETETRYVTAEEMFGIFQVDRQVH